jgi:hypothetical protein
MQGRKTHRTALQNCPRCRDFVGDVFVGDVVGYVFVGGIVGGEKQASHQRYQTNQIHQTTRYLDGPIDGPDTPDRPGRADPSDKP